MSPHTQHSLKRLQHDINSNSHLSSHNSRPQLPNDEALRESIQEFTITINVNNTNSYRPYKPGPRRARRGGGRTRDRHWYSSLNLPTRAINYDLAESFLDHSTNPLLSDIYSVKIKHSTKRWPNGRFINYKENLDKLDGNITEITCTRTFPIIKKRKQNVETSQNEQNNPTTTLTLPVLDPVAQEEKKKQVDQQSSIYASLFGGRKIPRIQPTTQPRKSNTTTATTSKSGSMAVSLLDENVTPNPQS